MSLLDIFKKPKKAKRSLSLDEKNRIYLAERNKEIERLNKAYDFNSVKGIRSIPVPCREVNAKDSSTGRVEYYLRGLCFAKHWEDGRKDLAIECLKKSQELMYVSDMLWKYDDFIKLVSYLHEAGLHDEARKEENKVDRFFEKKGFYPDLTQKDFESYESYCAWKKAIKESEENRTRKRELRHEYYWLQEHFPDLCPKSISGYSRSKNAKSKSYQEILRATNNFSGLR